MITTHIGEIAALFTAVCWTITATAFESAGKRIGSLSVNLIRLIMALIFISFFTLFSRGLLLPSDASASSWIWLTISGLIGFVLGDLFLFQAYVEIGSRVSMLIMSTAPPITALLGFIIMGERLSVMHIAGMLVTIGGIALVILVKNTDERSVEFSQPIKGLVYAFIGALGQALGLILSKYGMGSYNPFAATQIRIIAGLIGFAILITYHRKWNDLLMGIKDSKAMLYTSLGALFGPFIGVSLSLVAIKYTTTGAASTIMSIVPVMIIPVSFFIMKERITSKEVFGAFITVCGVSLLFMN
ncbi:MAG: DMT family transporter [Bacillota bacterium]